MKTLDELKAAYNGEGELYEYVNPVAEEYIEALEQRVEQLTEYRNMLIDRNLGMCRIARNALDNRKLHDVDILLGELMGLLSFGEGK